MAKPPQILFMRGLAGDMVCIHFIKLCGEFVAIAVTTTFLKFYVCPTCGGIMFSAAARTLANNPFMSTSGVWISYP
jgi:predicted RNA-binding Zn-ribbon protein involved in translation (DUF1610 family)